MDTQAVNTLLNKFFDDSRFLAYGNHNEILSEITGDTIDDTFFGVFLKKYISLCQSITSGRRDKIKQLLKKLRIDASNCQKELTARIAEMIRQCEESLSEEEKTLLQWNEVAKATENYASVPTEATIKKWLAETDFRNPNRLYLYKIAFSLGLKAYLPYEIVDENSDDYQTSLNFLFNKVYNQRYVTRAADELIFIFCLKKEKDYTTAMKMLAAYIEEAGQTAYNNTVNFQTKSNYTFLFINDNINSQEEDFVHDLVLLKPLLDDRYSSVFSQIEEFIRYFADKKKLSAYQRQHPLTEKLCSHSEAGKGYAYFGSKVLLSNILKKNLLFLDRRMTISSRMNRPFTAEQEKLLQRLFAEQGLSDQFYQKMKDSSTKSICKRFGNYAYPYFSDMLSDLLITEDEVYNPDIISRKSHNDDTYECCIKDPPYLSHNLLYRNLRSALITAHFFYYWSDTSADRSTKEYIDEINEVLMKNYYLRLYSKNSFDILFILCAKLYEKNIEPIDAYYQFFDAIVKIYWEYYAFFMSDPAISCEFIIRHYPLTLNATDLLKDSDEHVNRQGLHPIDQTSIQKKLLEPFIKKEAKK